MKILEEWLEQFELMTTTLSSSSQVKLANLINTIHDQAYSFFVFVLWSNVLVITYYLQSEVSNSHLPAVQSCLFYSFKMDISGMPDIYAQSLRAAGIHIRQITSARHFKATT